LLILVMQNAKFKMQMGLVSRCQLDSSLRTQCLHFAF
jgi:hypothetical protein